MKNRKRKRKKGKKEKEKKKKRINIGQKDKVPKITYRLVRKKAARVVYIKPRIYCIRGFL